MDVSSSVMMAEYYEKLIDLQDKLRRSEEERLKLEIKFSEIIQVTREEEQLHYRKLRHQYKIFLEEDRRRQERNEKIVKSLEKIDARISRLTSRTELYQRPRRSCRNCHHRSFPTTKSPCVNDTHKSEQEYQKERTDKLDVIDGCLSSLKSTPVTLMKPNKYERISTNDLDNLREGLNNRFDSNKANSIATEIMNSIYSRHYDRDNTDPKNLDISSQPIPKLSEPLHEETETSQLNIHNASTSYNKGNVRNIPGNETSGMTARKFHDSENKPAVETNNKFGSTIESNNKKVPQYQVENFELDALSSKRNGEETSFHEEHESKIVQELNCPTKENYSTDQDIINMKGPRKNLTDQQFLKKMPDIERSNVPIASQKSSLDVRSIAVNPSKSEDPQISKPEIQKEGGYVKLQEAPSTQINEGNRSEQSEEPQQIQEGLQTKRNNDSPSVEDDDHSDPQYDKRSENEPTNQYKTDQPIDQYAPQRDENRQAIQQHQVNTNDQYLDHYKPRYDQNGQVIQQQPLDGYGEHVHQYEHQQKEFVKNGQHVDQVLQQQQFDENGQHVDQCQPQSDEKSQVLQQQQFNEDGQHVDQYQPQYDENEQVLQQQQHYNENGQIIVDQYRPQYDQNGQEFQQYDDNGQPIEHAIQYDEHGQAIHYDENAEAIQYDENGQAIQYDQNGQAIHYDENAEAIQYDENGQAIQYDQNGQAIQYDQNGQAIQYDQNGQAIQYDENGQVIQYDHNGQVIQYDENAEAIQYDQNGQAIQYDENGQAIQYDENGQAIQYDQNGQAIQYDENGQAIQYDQNGQAIQYDQNGQAIRYDQNGQAIQYDENGQAIQYDEHGQPYPAYEGDPNLPTYGQYNENGEPLQQYDQQYHENQQPIEEYYDQTDVQAGDRNAENAREDEQMHSEQGRSDLNQGGERANISEQADTSEISLNPGAGGKVDGGQNKVLDMLDTDTDSVLQNTSKISNDSDFDF